MNSVSLLNIFIFLATACLVVPLAGKFKLGSVLGYLIAGVLIGPFGASLINNPEQIMHFAEFGIIMMLFIIGLELDPSTLWRLRKLIVALGGVQVVLTSALFTGIGLLIGFDWKLSLACGMALSLSSTALVLKMLEEKDLLQTSGGEASFSVLLFQDIAVIPILIILPLLAGNHSIKPDEADWFASLPAYAHMLLVIGVITAIVIAGRILARHVFRYIAKTNLREIFTAISLALVVGVTLLMEMIGVSPALGAFVAGIVLANSEYKHTLETDIEPFKGLLLGLFFISIGMGMDFDLFASSGGALLTAVLFLIAIKMLVLFISGRLFGLSGSHSILFTFALAQGGEFAFVLFKYMQEIRLLNSEHSAFLTLAVTISMALTPLLIILNEKFVIPRFMSRLPFREYDEIDEKDNPVIIAGYGRFGQIIGRFLRAQGVKVTILEKDPDQIELIRKFGGASYFGDASRLDLLHNAGAAKAKLFVVAVDDANKCLEIVRMAKQNFPNLKVFARARNRRHAYELHRAGVDYFKRETFDSSLTMAQEVMKFLGKDAAEMRVRATQFMLHDEKTLEKSFEFFEEEEQLISFSRQARGELQNILDQDIKVDKETGKIDESYLYNI